MVERGCVGAAPFSATRAGHHAGVGGGRRARVSSRGNAGGLGPCPQPKCYPGERLLQRIPPRTRSCAALAPRCRASRGSTLRLDLRSRGARNLMKLAFEKKKSSIGTIAITHVRVVETNLHRQRARSPPRRAGPVTGAFWPARAGGTARAWLGPRDATTRSPRKGHPRAARASVCACGANGRPSENHDLPLCAVQPRAAADGHAAPRTAMLLHEM